MAIGARALILAFLLAAAPAAAATKAVRLRILWSYDGVPEGMALYALKPGDWPTWRTEVVASTAQAPVAREIPGAAVSLGRGATMKAALVYVNRTGRPVRFFAAPHSVSPARAALGFKFLCLCTNHVYTVPPGASWYRVVELRVARDFAGESLDVAHQLVAVDGTRAEEFRQGMSKTEVP